MGIRSLIANSIHRFAQLHRTRKSTPSLTTEAQAENKRLSEIASTIADNSGPLEDYVAKFKNTIDEWMNTGTPVQFLTPGMMTEAGEPRYKDPRLGTVANARLKAVSWLEGDGKGNFKQKSLGIGSVCRERMQREVYRPLLEHKNDLQRESFRRRLAAQRENRQVESDPWGTTPDPVNWDWGTLRSSTALEKNLPYPPGPFTKQIYLPDMWKLDALVFQFCNYSGLARRALAIKVAYMLGNGVKIKFKDQDKAKNEKVQDEWDKFEDEAGFYKIYHTWAYQWFKYGELNVNPWILPGGKLRVRSIDRSTIWDQVTNPEDIYDIHGYWVQFTTQYQLFTQGTDGVKQPYTEYVMRMMPPESIILSKRNVDENEKRGRSDLIAALGVSSYYDDALRAAVTEQILRSSYVWDVEVQFGDQTDVDAEARKEGNFPKPGSSWFHTSSIQRKLVNAQGVSGSGKSNATQETVSAFAVASGVPEEFFGMAGQSNKAAALTGTAPFVKDTQVNQKLFEVEVLRPLVNFWLNGTNRKGMRFEVIFPEIAPADMYTKIQAIVLAQTSGYYSVETAATMTSKELNDTTFDFLDEKQKMDQEKAAAAVDSATEKNLYLGDHAAPAVATPGSPSQPKPIAQPGAGLPKLAQNKVTGPPGADDKLDGSGVGA